MNVLKPHLQTTIWTLLRSGATQREIARVTGISRHTIRAYQKQFAAQADQVATGTIQTAPPWPPTPVARAVPTEATAAATATTTVSHCEPHRAFIEAQMKVIVRRTPPLRRQCRQASI